MGRTAALLCDPTQPPTARFHANHVGRVSKARSGERTGKAVPDRVMVRLYATPRPNRARCSKRRMLISPGIMRHSSGLRRGRA
jgi:hypothetical protein